MPPILKNRSAQAGLLLSALVTGASSAKAADAASTNAPAAQPYGKKATEGFWRRLNEAFGEQNAMPVYTPPDTNSTAPVRRIGPPPFDGPPYPTQDWQIGGGPNVIGDPGALRDSPFPLMQAIYDGPKGKGWYDSRVMIYGWDTISANLSTSRNTSLGQTANFPEVYDERPNRIEQDQAVLYIERMADENQVDHVDWGFRLAAVYGLDYRFMGSRGFLSDQIVRNGRFMGFDMPMMYGNIYIPNVAQGMQIIVGRIISEPDIEQQLSPNNLMASHSIVYGFDNYTMWGIWTTTKLNANWAVQVGVADGVDIAPWQHDPGLQPTGSVLLQYIAPGGHDEVYGGMNSFNNGTFGFNNLQETIFSYTHKFNEKWWTTFEMQYMYMKHCTTGPTYYVPYQDGFYPKHPGFVWEGGIVNYTMRRLANNTFLTIRNEVYDDSGGARTGYATCYEESSIGISWWVNKLFLLRPELRFEHSFSEMAYDNGTRHNQFTAAFDATYHF